VNIVRNYKLRALAGATAFCLSMAAPRLVTAGDDANTPVNTIANTIVVKSFMFSPMNINVKAGTRVTWTNKDDEPHTVASDDGVFRSAALDTDESFSFKFDKPGTYHYTCTIHPRMIGTITVE
jgi:plastocyanin